MKIAFVDSTCPRPYDNAVLRSSGLGGTEATVVRIATALSTTHDVVVLQHNRQVPSIESDSLRFLPMDRVHEETKDADHVVFLTKAQGLARLAPQRRARLWLWVHNYLDEEIPFHWQDHLRHRLGIICVSRTHARHTRALIRRHRSNRLTLGYLGRAGVVHHYNPIDDALRPDPAVARYRHKLVFFSSPQKGIEQVLARFREAHEARPELRLFVANPGYLNRPDPQELAHPGIVRLGSLSHADLLGHLREALCVFYPQHQRTETFGLVYAESNAVGTPVLAHDFGAAREVLSPSNPPVDTRRPAAVLETLFDWIDHGAPTVGPDPRFATARVADGWRRFFDRPESYAAEQRNGNEDV